MARAAEDLAERLATVGRRFAQGCGAVLRDIGAAREVVLASGKADDAVRVEADAAFLGGETGIVATPGHVPLDPASIDLAVSLLSLQDENDIPGMLIQIRRALKPDGLFLGAMAGAGTLAELRESLLAAESRDLRRRQPARRCPSPTCAKSARCCSGRASPCRSPMSRR